MSGLARPLDPARTRSALVAAAAVAASAWSGSAWAVPAFAVQTGQPCQACHVGGFGPQLTPFGRSFKLHGYTTRATAFNVPLATMAVASYVHSAKAQAAPPADGFHTNDNLALDQVSLFLAGGLGSHLGAFVQATYDGVAKAWAWDNVDVRAVTDLTIKDQDVLLGVSLNNSPTVQDPWNTQGAWAYPYTDSALWPAPSAAPLLSGALAQTSLGVTGYAWINSTWYAEMGGYGSPGAGMLTRLGADPLSPGDIRKVAPYVRLGVQKSFGPQTVQAGVIGMLADIYPERDQSAGTWDRYADVGVDGSYQLTRQNGDVVTLNARYLHERQGLKASQALGLSQNSRDTLSDIRLDASYYWRDKFGFTAQAFQTTGSSDPVLYADNRRGRPDSSGLMFQADHTLFGDGSSPFGPRFNARVGVQYTLYDQFDGARRNYDGAGTNASDNNTARVFLWVAY